MLKLTVQQVSHLQVYNCKTLKTLAMTLRLWMMFHLSLQLELELLVIIRIRLGINFYYKINHVLCIVVVYCFDE